MTITEKLRSAFGYSDVIADTPLNLEEGERLPAQFIERSKASCTSSTTKKLMFAVAATIAIVCLALFAHPLAAGIFGAVAFVGLALWFLSSMIGVDANVDRLSRLSKREIEMSGRDLQNLTDYLETSQNGVPGLDEARINQIKLTGS